MTRFHVSLSCKGQQHTNTQLCYRQISCTKRLRFLMLSLAEYHNNPAVNVNICYSTGRLVIYCTNFIISQVHKTINSHFPQKLKSPFLLRIIDCHNLCDQRNMTCIIAMHATRHNTHAVKISSTNLPYTCQSSGRPPDSNVSSTQANNKHDEHSLEHGINNENKHFEYGDTLMQSISW